MDQSRAPQRAGQALQERGAEYILPLHCRTRRGSRPAPTWVHSAFEIPIPQIADMLIRKLEGN